jgi:hypothetical protein
MSLRSWVRDLKGVWDYEKGMMMRRRRGRIVPVEGG